MKERGTPMELDVQDIAEPVLLVGAHPEDLDIHAGGTVARLRNVDKHVVYVLCSSGNRGTDDPSLTMERLGAIREDEQERAADILGVQDITFLRHDDGDLQFDERELRGELVRLIRRYRPGSVVTHDPHPGDGSHDPCSIYPDHLTVGKVTFEAAYIAAPAPLYYPEQLEEGLGPHKPETLYLIMSQAPNRYVDITDVWEQKMAAVHSFQSQGRHHPQVEPFFQEIASQLGKQTGGGLAEAFRALPPG